VNGAVVVEQQGGDEYPAPPMDFRGPPPMHHYPEHRPPYDDFRGRYDPPMMVLPLV
jgi:hypothetical protein